MENALILGVDGGGTHSRLAAVRPDGTVVAAAPGAGVNFNIVGMDTARKRLYDAVRSLLAQCGANDYGTLCVGMSALDNEPDEELLRTFAGGLFDWRRLEMNSDAYMALMSATLGEPGAMVVSGTGAMVIALDATGRVHRRAGWGYLLDDPGSAYGIAVQGIRAALACWKGIGEETALKYRVRDFFCVDDPRALLSKLYSPAMEPSQIAQFARGILESAAAGDAVSRRLIQDNIDYLAGQAHRLLDMCPPGSPVGLYGGMFQHNAWVAALFREKLAQLRPQARAANLELPPQIGAVISHFRRIGGLNAGVVARLRATWKECPQ
ncbi:MAG: hypothetical protein GX558_00925 [Clostridiales bacterium]|nr:hypothetical protein [Clostridiales bacterium]